MDNQIGYYPDEPESRIKEVRVSDAINYVPAFLTLDCNLSCSYCINDDSGVVKERSMMSPEEWVRGLNRLKLKKDLPITFQGGEPTAYLGFYEVINKINHPIDILTNLQFNIDEFISMVKPERLHKGRKPYYKSIRVSYHSQSMEAGETLDRIVKLQDAGFNIGLFALNLPELTEANMEMSELAREKNVYFFIKDFLGKRDDRLFGFYRYPEALDGEKKDAYCRSRDLLTAPDGKIYRCHRDLYHAENSIAHILDKDLKAEYKFRYCSNYGECNPCDIKEKTNRFLQQGFSTVEINIPIPLKGEKELNIK